jgi:hypothetical protein
MQRNRQKRKKILAKNDICFFCGFFSHLFCKKGFDMFLKSPTKRQKNARFFLMFLESPKMQDLILVKKMR